ncbi:MAG TPA: ABC transporter permease [Puia sp.]|jgi:putative ABC transport system permease protein
MLKNYFKTAWRNIVNNRLYSLINVTGLTAGLAVGILILLWVQDELSFDQYHHKAARIYKVNSPIGMGPSRRVWGTTQGAVAAHAVKDIPAVAGAVRIIANYDHTVYSYKDRTFQEPAAAYTDPTLLQLFDFTLIRGDRNKLFPNDQSILITQSTAKKYFGDEDPIGKVIQGDHKDNYTVSGVLEDFPDNSSIHYNMFFPMALVAREYEEPGAFWKNLDNDWGNFGYITFLEVRPGADVKKIGEQLIRIQAANAPHIKVSLTENAFELQPLKDIHLHEADGKAPAQQTVKIFFVIAVLILLIASINYVNLSTARAMLRAKEVSIRKIVGAEKRQLFAQFIIESVLFFLIALLLALLVIWLLIPSYNELSHKHLRLDLLDGRLWGTVLIAGIGTIAASAIYPAVLLSSFEPLKALKGKLRSGIGNVVFRKVLVTTQFVVSVTLIIGTLVIGRQLNYIRQLDPGYDRSQVFYFPARQMQGHMAAVKAGLQRQSSILAVTTTNSNLVNNGRTTGDVVWDGKDVNSTFIIYPMAVDEQFIPSLKMKMAEGANFTGVPTDSAHFILNETAARMMGIKNPIGQRLSLWGQKGTIIGIAKDYNFASMKVRIEPAVLYFSPASSLLYIKTTGREATAAIAAVKGLWEQYNPGLPFEYTFLDEKYGALYASDQRTGSLLNIFSVIAILISCLGLLGLATYTAQVRIKEIGIRKVLGASVTNIMTLMVRNFLSLVVIAILIASPVAWWAMNGWLQNFAYHITVSWWIFVLAGAAAILIALATISFQSIKAALMNPIKSLRSE